MVSPSLIIKCLLLSAIITMATPIKMSKLQEKIDFIQQLLSNSTGHSTNDTSENQSLNLKDILTRKLTLINLILNKIKEKKSAEIDKLKQLLQEGLKSHKNSGEHKTNNYDNSPKHTPAGYDYQDKKNPLKYETDESLESLEESGEKSKTDDSFLTSRPTSPSSNPDENVKDSGEIDELKSEKEASELFDVTSEAPSSSYLGTQKPENEYPDKPKTTEVDKTEKETIKETKPASEYPNEPKVTEIDKEEKEIIKETPTKPVTPAPEKYSDKSKTTEVDKTEREIIKETKPAQPHSEYPNEPKVTEIDKEEKIIIKETPTKPVTPAPEEYSDKPKTTETHKHPETSNQYDKPKTKEPNDFIKKLKYDILSKLDKPDVKSLLDEILKHIPKDKLDEVEDKVHKILNLDVKKLMCSALCDTTQA